MKKRIAITFLFMCFTLSSFSQDTLKTTKHKPKATYQVGYSKVKVWEYKSENGTWKSFQVENIYKKDGEWQISNSYNATELLELKAAIEKAIAEEIVIIEIPEEKF